jgi:hypothetical protein
MDMHGNLYNAGAANASNKLQSQMASNAANSSSILGDIGSFVGGVAQAGNNFGLWGKK